MVIGGYFPCAFARPPTVCERIPRKHHGLSALNQIVTYVVLVTHDNGAIDVLGPLQYIDG